MMVKFACVSHSTYRLSFFLIFESKENMCMKYTVKSVEMIKETREKFFRLHSWFFHSFSSTCTTHRIIDTKQHRTGWSWWLLTRSLNFFSFQTGSTVCIRAHVQSSSWFRSSYTQNWKNLEKFIFQLEKPKRNHKKINCCRFDFGRNFHKFLKSI